MGVDKSKSLPPAEQENKCLSIHTKKKATEEGLGNSPNTHNTKAEIHLLHTDKALSQSPDTEPGLELPPSPPQLLPKQSKGTPLLERSV